MDYRRVYDGFYVSGLRVRKGFRSNAYHGKIFSNEDGVLVCKFSQRGNGEPTEIRWSPSANSHVDRLVSLGLDAINENAKIRGNRVISLSEALQDNTIRDHAASLGIETLCNDRLDDDYYRANHHRTIFVRLNTGEVYSATGQYNPLREEAIKRQFYSSLKPGETIVEIINARYRNM